MNIFVCVKQVPDTAEMKIDPVTNNLVRDGVTNIMNPYDQYAWKRLWKSKIPWVPRLRSSPWDRPMLNPS